MRIIDVLAAILGSLSMQDGFDKEGAYNDAQYAQAAYCGPENYMDMEWLGRTAGFKPTRMLYNKEYDVAGYVGVNERTSEIIVAFRGSESIPNWITNLDFRKSDYPHCEGCEVHTGFYHAMQSVYDDVLEEVSDLTAAYDYPLRVTGHSLGGALALLSALELRAVGFSVVSNTFGCPRLGTDAFAAYASAQLPGAQRNTHAGDVVPHLPFESFGFRQYATEIWQSSDDAFHVCDASGEDPKCMDSISATEYSVHDHYTYIGVSITECPADVKYTDAKKPKATAEGEDRPAAAMEAA